MWHIWGTGVVHSGDWWGNPRKRIFIEDLAFDIIMLKWVFKVCDW
jgi:hypothetical protein